MNWSPFPFFRLAIFFIAGILIFENCHPSFKFVLISLSINGCLWAFSELYIKEINQKKLFTGLSLLLVVLSLGMLVTQFKTEKQLKSNFISDANQTVYQGFIKDKLKFNPKPKFVVQTNVNTAEHNYLAEIILTFTEGDTLAHSYGIGDEIIFKTKLKPIQDLKNPDAFNYAKFLKYKGIMLNGFVNQNQHQLLSEQNIGIFSKFALQASTYSEHVIDKNIQNEAVAGIAKALLTGNKNNLDQNIYKAYADTGAIHVLSVSGLHVAIFISLFVFLFEKIKTKSLPYTLFKVGSLLLIVWFYVILTGMSPSVLRAGVMVSMYLIGKTLFKGVNSFNIISIAAITMLIYNPYFLFQASFQFSFISLLSILYFQPKIKKWINVENKILRFIWDLIVVSLAAQILMFPFTVYNFHQFPLTFALSGIVAVPIVTVIIYLGTLMIVMDPITHLGSKIIGQFIEKVIELLNIVIIWMSKIPYTIIDQIWINTLNICLLIFSVVCLIHWYEMKKKTSFYLSLASLLTVVCVLSLEKINASTQEGFTIYHTYNNDIIDIFKGTKVYRFVKHENQFLNLDMICKNHNIKSRTKNIITTHEKIHTADDKVLLILSDKEDLVRLNPSTHYDYVYVSINLPPEKIISNIKAGLYILSPTLKPWYSKKWLLLQQKSKMDIHQIKNEGPFIYRI